MSSEKNDQAGRRPDLNCSICGTTFESKYCSQCGARLGSFEDRPMQSARISVCDKKRPGLCEWFLFVFVLFGLWAGLVSFWNGEVHWSHNENYKNPFFTYYQNPGIQLISKLALAVDMGVAALILVWAVARSKAKFLLYILLLLASVGAFLTWFELWYGSTFYYGEVRDKQGLPVGVNNGGIIGSFVFLTYLLWRVDVRSMPARTQVPIKVVLTVGLFFFQKVLVGILAEPWKIWSS